MFIVALLLVPACAALDTSFTAVHPSMNMADLHLRFTVTNRGNASETVATDFTPLEGIYGDILKVRDESGVAMDYVGRVARRAGPPKTITVAPGETVSNTVNAADAYQLSHDGKYTFAFGAAVARVSVTATATYTHPAAGRRPAGGSRSYMACTSQETSDIEAADVQCEVEAKNSIACLKDRTCDSQYNEWFGEETPTRYSQVQTDFDSIYEYLPTSRYNCDDCRNDRNVYAYVYPSDQTQTIYLCGAFWSLPEERANTIIHEVSHFNYVARTDDYAYGKTACRNLARNNPNNAIRNADNVCYFSEAAPSKQA